MKVCVIFLYGLFGLSVFLFSRAELKQSSWSSFFIAVFVLLQIAALRISWDLYRNLLGLSLLLITLTCLSVLSGRIKYATVTILLIIIAFTHQLVAGLLLLLLLGTFVWDLVNKRQNVASAVLLLSR